MQENQRHIVIVGGGTAGSVLASRLSELANLKITLLEAGADDSTYDDYVLDPALAPDAWKGACPTKPTMMKSDHGDISIFQARLLGGMSAANGLATLRGLPVDYDGWAASGLEGWAWEDVVETFKSLENDMDFGNTPLHRGDGPLSVRRWRRDEMSHAQIAFQDGMVEAGYNAVNDINDPGQLPGIGVFPVTIDKNSRRLTTSLAFLSPEVRQRDNLIIRTNAEVHRILFDGKRACGVSLKDGEEVLADELIISTGALWTPMLLMRSGIGPAAHLAEHGIATRADLPVGETLADHLGPGVYFRHEGPRGGTAGPAQSLFIGASDGTNPDYHLFPIARAPSEENSGTHSMFVMAAFLMRSSCKGSVKLGEKEEDGPQVVAPPMPDKGMDILRHAFARIAEWEETQAFAKSGCERLVPMDLRAEDAVQQTLERAYLSYGHMTSTCPMGTVLDADCNVLGIDDLRVVDASSMPDIPAGNTYLGCAMMAERVAAKIAAKTS